jgi:hypothetical protein
VDINFTVAATGSIQHSMIDRSVATDLVHGTDNFTGYLTVAVGAGAGAVSAAVGLAGQVQHPIVIYFIVCIEAVAGVILGYLAKKEWGRVKLQRRVLADAANGITINISATSSTVPGHLTTGLPPTVGGRHTRPSGLVIPPTSQT